MRPMRRANQALSDEVVRHILETEKRGVLSLLGDDGYPYGVPLDFVLRGDTIYFHSAKEGHKLDAIAACDKASFCVLSRGELDERDGWSYFWNSVIAFGRMRVVTDPSEKEQALRALGQKYFPTADEVERELQKDGARVACLALSIEHITGKRVHER